MQRSVSLSPMTHRHCTAFWEHEAGCLSPLTLESGDVSCTCMSRVQWNRSADTLRSATLRSEKRFTPHSTRSIPCCANSENPNPSLRSPVSSLFLLSLSPHPRLPPNRNRPLRRGLGPDRLRVDSTARRDGCKKKKFERTVTCRWCRGRLATRTLKVG